MIRPFSQFVELTKRFQRPTNGDEVSTTSGEISASNVADGSIMGEVYRLNKIGKALGAFNDAIMNAEL
jgi:hypothetical protein